jgi:hypothetical protein
MTTNIVILLKISKNNYWNINWNFLINSTGRKNIFFLLDKNYGNFIFDLPDDMLFFYQPIYS